MWYILIIVAIIVVIALKIIFKKSPKGDNKPKDYDEEWGSSAIDYKNDEWENQPRTSGNGW